MFGVIFNHLKEKITPSELSLKCGTSTYKNSEMTYILNLVVVLYGQLCFNASFHPANAMQTL